MKYIITITTINGSRISYIQPAADKTEAERMARLKYERYDISNIEVEEETVSEPKQ